LSTEIAPERPEPPPSALTVAHIVYALHSFAIVVGIVGAATIIGSFIGSVPSIIAVIINYVKRRDARGTWAESHYRWQIRTFWYAILWLLLAILLMVTIIGIPIGLGLIVAITFWLIYRIARGWLRLVNRRPMYE
jgi:uncharacterized membrane protein